MGTPVLNTFAKQYNYEKFDASNPEHITAYVCIKKLGRQHPTLRFYLEDPFLNIPDLMESRIGDAFLEQFGDLVTAANDIIEANRAKPSDASVFAS